MFAFRVGLSKLDPSGHSPIDDDSEDDCPCEIYESRDLKPTAMQLQAWRTQGHPDTGAEGELTILNLEIAQAVFNVMNLAGAGATNSLDDAIAELANIEMFPTAGDTVDGIRSIWENSKQWFIESTRAGHVDQSGRQVL